MDQSCFGKVQNYVDEAVTWTRRNVQESGVYLVFDIHGVQHQRQSSIHQTEGSKPTASPYVDHAVNHKMYR